MAHTCPTCGNYCTCGCDIEDAIQDFNDFCIHCYEDDEQEFEEEEYWHAIDEIIEEEE